MYTHQPLQAEIRLKGKPIKGEEGGGSCRWPTERDGRVERLLFQMAGAVEAVKKKALATRVAEIVNGQGVEGCTEEGTEDIAACGGVCQLVLG